MTSVAPAPNFADVTSIQEELTRLFAYKAEWLDQELFELFQSPGYFPELKVNQSCVLIGGRGTGKTTVLRGLSYEGQQKLDKKPPQDWDFFGVYYRIDSNRVSALQGLGLQDEEWQRPFAHYINLIISSIILKMLSWYQRQTNTQEALLEDPAWELFYASLALPAAPSTLTIDNLSRTVELAIARFEIYINNIHDSEDSKTPLSILGKPIDSLVDAANSLPGFAGKRIYILLDEYESFSDYQQRTVNTLIKQSAGRNYCFKVGVRELGWRAKHTLNDQELRSPSDFRRIQISTTFKKGNPFSSFAEKVCNARLAKVKPEIEIIKDIKKLLPSISNLKEAKILGVEKLTKNILENKDIKLSTEQLNILRQEQPMYVWFGHEWQTRQAKKNISSRKALLNLIQDPKTWKKRFDNYIYAALFAIRERKRGFRKYYAGWETFVLMSGGNIRFLLQLVEQALREHSKTPDIISKPITIDAQTRAAVYIGENNLSELEGLDVKGGKIMKLLQGIGRIFQIYAASPFGRAPEVNQFYVPELNGEAKGPILMVKQAQDLLETAYSHLALQRTPSTKLTSDSSKGYDYYIHPIFSAYFQFSHRKKRKTKFSAAQILGFVSNQAATTDAVLGNTKVEDDIVSSYSIAPGRRRKGPQQLSLFPTDPQ